MVCGSLLSVCCSLVQGKTNGLGLVLFFIFQFCALNDETTVEEISQITISPAKRPQASRLLLASFSCNKGGRSEIMILPGRFINFLPGLSEIYRNTISHFDSFILFKLFIKFVLVCDTVV